MKKLLLITFSLLITNNAFGYSSNVGSDPANGQDDIETKQYKKSTDSGESDAIAKGDILVYDQSAADGYTVTRVGVRDVLNSALIAGIAVDAVATGDVAYHRMITKGFVNYLKYDADTAAIAVGNKLCPTGSEGQATACDICDSEGGDNDCKLGEASENSGIVALEAKSSGTGTMSALINLGK